MIITVDTLKSMGACDTVPFVRCFGESAEVTRENLLNAIDSQLPVDWLGKKLFGDKYTDAMNLHRSVFVKAMEDSAATLRQSTEWRDRKALIESSWSTLIAETAQSKPGAYAKYNESMIKADEVHATLPYLQWRQANTDALRALNLDRVSVFLKLAKAGAA